MKSAPARSDYRPRSLGLQCSVSDAVVLLAGAGAAWWLWQPMPEIALLVTFVVGHFFLFCNVFRIHRKFELTWAAAFIANVVAGIHSGAWGLTQAMLWQIPLTVVFILAEMRTARYHGVGCGIINRAQVARWRDALESG